MSDISDIHDIIRQRLARRMRELRAGQGLTQEATAHRAGLIVRHFQKIEAGQVNITLRSLAKLAAALDVDVGELLRYEETGSSK